MLYICRHTGRCQVVQYCEKSRLISPRDGARHPPQTGKVKVIFFFKLIFPLPYLPAAFPSAVASVCLAPRLIKLCVTDAVVGGRLWLVHMQPGPFPVTSTLCRWKSAALGRIFFTPQLMCQDAVFFPSVGEGG